MSWLQENMKQQGFIKVSTAMVAMLLTIVVVISSYTSQSSIALAQQQEQQQFTSSVDRFVVDKTLVAQNTVSQSLGQLATEEGGASIPLSAELSGDEFLPVIIDLILTDSEAPVITLQSPLPDQVINEGDLIVSGFISELATVTVNGVEVPLNGNNQFSTTITVTENDTLISVVALDQDGNETVKVVEITVIPVEVNAEVNNAPIIMTTPNTAAVTGELYTYNVIAVDPNGDELSYRLLDAPVGLQINSTTGQVTWTPFDFGSESVTIQVADSFGLTAEQTYTINTSFPEDQQPPLLNPIGDIIAPLGQTTRRTIQAVDPEGDTIIYGISPLPLPEGMTFEPSTGLFEYRPALEDVGIRSFTFSASDGRFTSSQTIQITVPEPSDTTSFSGTALLYDGRPLENVRFTINGQEAMTDQNGNFLIEDINVSGVQPFFIDGSDVDPTLGTFASITEQFFFIEGAENQLIAPVFLQPLDLFAGSDIDPFQPTVVNSEDVIVNGVNYGPITLTVEPRTAVLTDRPGEFFNDVLSISRIVDSSNSPQPLPDDMDVSLLITIQPFGVLFTEPAEISFPNIEGFAAGTTVEIFTLNHETGVFEVTGEAIVSDDGTRLDSIGGAIFNSSWSAPSPSGPEPGPESDDCDCEGESPANSSFGRKTGNFKDSYQTPSYYSVSEARNVTLVYNSKWAFPQPILNFNTLVRIPQAVSASQQLQIGGIETAEVFMETQPLDLPFLNGEFPSQRVINNAVQFDASEFESGIYPYTFTVNSNFPMSRRSGSTEGQTVIINESKSPYGAGWSVKDLRRIYVSEDRAFVAMDLANGNFWRFTRNPEDGTYEAPAGHFSDLFENSDGSFRLVTKNGTQYNFDLQGLLTSVSDRNNNETFYTYDNDERLTVITDPIGLQTRFTYLGKTLQRITDPSGRFVEFEHDSEGNLITIKDPDNTQISYAYQPLTHLRTEKISKRGFRSEVSYDQFGRYASVVLPDGSVRTGRNQDTLGLPDLSEVTGSEDDLAPAAPDDEGVDSGYIDANGNFKRYQYSNSGYLMNTTDAVGRTTEIERDADENPIMTLRPNGSVLRRTYDDNGNVLTSLEEFNGALTTYTYDEFSLTTSMVDALDRTTIMDRDERGNLIRSENAEGHVSTMDYNSRGQVTRMVDPNGLVTEYEYNAEFLMVRKTETPPEGNVRVSTIEYNNIGLPLLTVSADGIEQTFGYDALNRQTIVENQLGESQETVYDEYGNVIESRVLNIDGSIATQETRVYDNRERLIEMSQPHEEGIFSVTTYEYDANSNIIRMSDPDQKETRYEYDEENRKIRIFYPDGGISAYEYDTRDQIVSVNTPNGATTTYEYDVLTRKLAENSPDRGRWTWDYNLVDQVTRQTDNRAVTIDYTYDLIDRVETKTFPTTSENVTYTYDDCSAGVGRLCERDDESGQYTYEYDFFGNVLDMTRTELGVTYTESYVYDDGDNVLQCTYPTGRVVDYERDGIRRIASIESNGTSIINNFSYRGDSQMIGRSWANGIDEIRQYDQQARLLNIGLGNISQRDYRYDSSSNIISINSPFQTGLYDYDLNDRLTNESINTTGDTRFDYDLNGNRLRELQNQGEVDQAYIYEQNSNRLLSTEEVTENSIAEAQVNRVLTHNDADRIRSITVDNQVVGTYFYNDLGLRSRKEVTNDTGETEITIYHYNMYGGLISETSATGQTQRDYIWNGMEPVSQIDPEGLSYLHSDHLYTTRLATNETQQVVWQWESGAFGNTEPQVETVEMNLRLPGQYVDTESGLYYNWNRYYDADLGRYVTSDPIGLSGGSNTYAYAEANPVIKYDFNGLKTCGSGWNEPLVPDNPVGYNFSPCCSSHDNCYGTCGNGKAQCDNDFYNCMLNKCKAFRHHPVCKWLAKQYYNAVNKFGGPAYNNAQQNACQQCFP